MKMALSCGCCTSIDVTIGRPVEPIGDGATYSRPSLLDTEIEVGDSWVANTWMEPNFSNFLASDLLACHIYNQTISRNPRTLNTLPSAPHPPGDPPPTSTERITAIYLSTALRFKISDNALNVQFTTQETRQIARATTVPAESHVKDIKITGITIDPPMCRRGMNGFVPRITHAQARVNGVAVTGVVAIPPTPPAVLVNAQATWGADYEVGSTFGLTFDAPVKFSDSLIEVDIWVALTDWADGVLGFNNISGTGEYVFASYFGLEDVDPATFPVTAPQSKIQWLAKQKVRTNEFDLESSFTLNGTTVWNSGTWTVTYDETKVTWYQVVDPDSFSPKVYVVVLDWSKEIAEIYTAQVEPAGSYLRRYVPVDSGHYQVNNSSPKKPGVFDWRGETTFVYHSKLASDSFSISGGGDITYSTKAWTREPSGIIQAQQFTVSRS